MFEDRERGYEAKWAHDEEMLFRIMAKRDAGLGEWAAGLMKLSPADTSNYVQAVISVGLTRKETDPVLGKIHADLASRGIGCTDATLFAKARSLFEEAKAALLKEGRSA